jgi:hypothetical protein
VSFCLTVVAIDRLSDSWSSSNPSNFSTSFCLIFSKLMVSTCLVISVLPLEVFFFDCLKPLYMFSFLEFPYEAVSIFYLE